MELALAGVWCSSQHSEIFGKEQSSRLAAHRVDRSVASLCKQKDLPDPPKYQPRERFRYFCYLIQNWQRTPDLLTHKRREAHFLVGMGKMFGPTMTEIEFRQPVRCQAGSKL